MFWFRVESERIKGEKETGDDEPTDVLVLKDQIRERDGRKCRDCGMTSEESVAKYGKDLDVHRLIPGMYYTASWCVTLCRACHGRKVKKALDAFWSEDLRFLCFSLYDPEDATMWNAIRSVAAGQGTDEGHVMLNALRYVLSQWQERDRADMLAQADGLD